MKKILFRKLLVDCLVFFMISLFSASVIIWVFQAVNFLDIMVEDGRDYLVYLNYTLLSFPKIVSKIFPFAMFFSFMYTITRYELNNELIIFWNFGVHKIELINFFIKFSFILMLIQMTLTIYLVPITENYSRTLIKSSNVDFFENFIKPKKFNDNIKGLTIFTDEKDQDGNLKNIYLKKDTGDNSFQITYAKTGYFKKIGSTKVLVLNNGQTINGAGNKISNFNFISSDLALSQLDVGIIQVNKIQETKTLELISCLKNYFDKNLKLKKKYLIEVKQNCGYENLDNIFKELYKRFVIPIYIPILIIIAFMLTIYSKENVNYLKYRIFIFIFGFIIIIFSETTLNFIKNNFYENIFFIILPLIFFLIIYIYIWFNFKTISTSIKINK